MSTGSVSAMRTVYAAEFRPTISVCRQQVRGTPIDKKSARAIAAHVTLELTAIDKWCFLADGGNHQRRCFRSSAAAPAFYCTRLAGESLSTLPDYLCEYGRQASNRGSVNMYYFERTKMRVNELIQPTSDRNIYFNTLKAPFALALGLPWYNLVQPKAFQGRLTC
ncbi:uncharacterized protein BDR25DRAFT_348598 [Lindgomyces ingoldianus]|uniref:Uncharacterized protein n=1 Tax=Lindgomyces ingoldianus TaxID=673940 RepID=A0ACB6RGE4_9PLEO|nr:uncharacterized protein BDR25DRAFT_348598 [Lindgomyces ingoldianus]KAF2478348.1 hypothetical protein BDR25DRAFT_348598 [Lindgomyces ingoldianus]